MALADKQASLVFIENNNYFLHSVDGAFDLFEMQRRAERLLSHPQFEPCIKTLWDLRNASLNSDAISQLFEHQDQLVMLREGHPSVAIIVSDHFQHRVISTYFKLVGRVTQSWGVFIKYEDAESWILSN